MSVFGGGTTSQRWSLCKVSDKECNDAEFMEGTAWRGNSAVGQPNPEGCRFDMALGSSVQLDFWLVLGIYWCCLALGLDPAGEFGVFLR